MQTTSKSLLVRADFVLSKRQGGDGQAYKRWRRILKEALPRLLGCQRRCSTAEKVRLRFIEGEGALLRLVANPHPAAAGWKANPQVQGAPARPS